MPTVKRERRPERPAKHFDYHAAMEAFRAELEEELRRKAEWERHGSR